jgi:hypothetical protein
MSLEDIRASAKTKIAKAFIIRITNGEYAGRCIGMRFGGGLVTNPEVQKNPPINLEGLNYGLWAQERAATRFLEDNAAPVLAALNKAGLKSELIKVQG